MLMVSACARRPEPLSAAVVNDRSVVFPGESEAEAITVGQPGVSYSLDGDVLRALVIVANDLFPPGTRAASCPKRMEAQTYRVVRKGDVIFVFIEENLAACGRRFPAMDSGAKYAIGADGRILRRVVDGLDEDDANWFAVTPGDGGSPSEADAGSSPQRVWMSDGGTEGLVPGQSLAPVVAPNPRRSADAGSP
ncbi:hypothetical protein DRW03_19965 [Corallococcus sp. H22C18031201]|uniref:hypothetical protein n=1 Tax=Citreicoccus inhibens TaxID=2849499 RepID=UPI000E72A598|nr:hypothetical protein [Citreicoccus inhibens]MBU8895611.1 hypothetical protein [Citreicoccus inhibens]RJS20048.1 hypothetical protein DRW03_19965 [Corallococcus sp. H22C18031201]